MSEGGTKVNCLREELRSPMSEGGTKVTYV